mmetsp:Transcript_41806/g.46687  ORF Transcript_41806/g.46687 Transcript_41806/m.46687 type:complete len:80 (+) Transcript_41806:259-498(+)
MRISSYFNEDNKNDLIIQYKMSLGTSVLLLNRAQQKDSFVSQKIKCIHIVIIKSFQLAYSNRNYEYRENNIVLTMMVFL